MTTVASRTTHILTVSTSLHTPLNSTLPTLNRHTHGQAVLPSHSTIRHEIGQHLTWLAGLASRGYNMSPGNIDAGPWMRAINRLGGTGVDEDLGYGWKGWWFWARNMQLSNLLASGVWSRRSCRVFDEKRKAWDGARVAVERVVG
jgi:dimethylaniline monooxygenase (N-oxide forming)